MLIISGLAVLLVASAHGQWSYQPSAPYQFTQTQWSWEKPTLNSYQPWTPPLSPSTSSLLVNIPTWSDFRTQFDTPIRVPAPVPTPSACIPTMCATIHAPVCGFKADGGTQEFPNLCSYNNHVRCNVRVGTFTMYLDGKCQQYRPQQTPKTTDSACVTICGKSYVPICGINENGKKQTFPNRCEYEGHLRCYPGSYHRTVPGRCEDVSAAPAPHTPRTVPAPAERDCNVMCGMVYEPVCGINENGKKQTFGNFCEYHGHVKCYPGSYTRSLPGRCEDVSRGHENSPAERDCNVMCGMVYQPVCGINENGKKQTFGNSCEYNGHVRCYPGSYSRSAPGRCEDVSPAPKPKIPSHGPEDMWIACYNTQKCSTAYQPICGLNSKGERETFVNKCDYESAQKCNPQNYNQKDFTEGACNGSGPGPRFDANPKSTHPCPGMCTHEVSPVCAISEKTGKSTFFQNSCQFHDHKRCYPDGDWVMSTRERCEADGHDPYGRSRPAQPPSKPTPAPTTPPKIPSHGPEDMWIACYNTQKCSTAYQPICGLNSKGEQETFVNKCDYESAQKCNPQNYNQKNWTEGPCGGSKTGGPRFEENAGPRMSCPGICPHNYAPVCATNEQTGKTYTFSNRCDYSDHQRCNPDSGYSKTVPGRCEDVAPASAAPTKKKTPQEIQECKAKQGCAMNYDPVCAEKVDGTKQTFSNSCAYNIDKGCEPEKFTGKSTKGQC